MKYKREGVSHVMGVPSDLPAISCSHMMVDMKYVQVKFPFFRSRRSYKYFSKKSKYWATVKVENALILDGTLFVGPDTYNELMKLKTLADVETPS